MNKDMLKYYLSVRGFSMYESVIFINALLDTIKETLVREESLKLHGFGTFDVIRREAHNWINPKTRELTTIDSFKYVSFKAGASLKRRVNQGAKAMNDEQIQDC